MTGYKATQIRKPEEEADFEKKVGVLFRDILNDPNVKRVGRRGQKQHGLDLVGRRDGKPKRVVGIQCKLKGGEKVLTEQEVKTEVARALKYRPKLVEYFIVTTAPDDTKLQQLGLTLAQRQAKNGRSIVIEVWGWGTLQERINESVKAKNAFDPGFSPSIQEHGQKLDTLIQGQQGLATAGQLQALASKLDLRKSVDLNQLPTAYADRELKREQTRILRSRGFMGVDMAQELSQLAKRALDGDLALASGAIRSDVFQRAARSNADTDVDLARQYLAAARRFDPDADVVVLEALLLDADGKSDVAIGFLRRHNTPDARTITFNLIARRKSPTTALQWLKSEQKTILDFSPPGALNILARRTESEQFDVALTECRELPANYFDQCPVLHLMKANLIVASIVPQDHKPAVFNGLPINPRMLQIASDRASKIQIKNARTELSEALKAVRELRLDRVYEALSEYDLWLQLEHDETKSTALETLTKEISQPETTLLRLKLGLAYGVKFNREALKRNLQSRKDTIGWTEDERFGAFLLAFHSRNPSEIADFFDRNRDDLYSQTQLSRDLLAAIEIESLARSNRLGDAKARLASLRGTYLTDDYVRHLEEVIEGIEKGDEPERIRQRYENSREPGDLRLLVHGLYERSDTRQLAKYAPTLARITKRSEDFSLAIKALFNERRYSELVELCRELNDLYVLEVDHKSLLAWALFNLGSVVEARTLVRELLETRNDANDRELAINTAVESGDWGYLQSILTREISRMDSLEASSLTRLARVALEVDSPYVNQFRDAALEKAPDDPDVLLAAYVLSVERGEEYQETRAHEWFQKAASLSKEGAPIESVSFKELVNRASGWNRQVSHIAQLLQEAKVPISLAAKGLRKQTVDFIVGQAIRNSTQENTRRQVPILAVSGAHRPIDIAGVRCVALDPTSIFTLEFLGLLQVALGAFEKVVIAPTTLSALFVERQFLRVRQPSEKAKAERIIRLITSGRLKVLPVPEVSGSFIDTEIGGELADMLRRAQDDSGVVVRSAPVSKVGSLLDEEANVSAFATVLADTHSVLSFLKGKIDGTTEKNATSYLRQVDRGWPNGAAINSKSKVYLDDLSVSYLDYVGLLEPFSKAVGVVFVPKEVESRASDVIKEAEYSEALLAFIERVRSTMNAGIDSGKVTFSKRRSRNKDDQDDTAVASFPSLDILADLIGIDVVVCDDRYLNKDQCWTDTQRRVLVASSYDLLSHLCAQKLVDQDRRVEAHHRLRQAGYCVLPLDQAELLSHLQRATLVEGAVIETPELRAIRENLTLPLRAEVFLEYDAPWFLHIRFCVIQAIRSVWSSDESNDIVVAKADWLYDLLPDPIAWCLKPDDEQSWTNACQQYCLQIGLLLILTDGDRERRQRFKAWTEAKVSEPARLLRPWLWDDVLKFVKSYLGQLVDSTNEKK